MDGEVGTLEHWRHRQEPLEIGGLDETADHGVQRGEQR
jgi:hypothetical protein